jgi:DNA-binding beta-propeller fold protein YncE
MGGGAIGSSCACSNSSANTSSGDQGDGAASSDPGKASSETHGSGNSGNGSGSIEAGELDTGAGACSGALGCEGPGAHAAERSGGAHADPGRTGLAAGTMVGLGQLQWPGGLAIDSAGRLAVGDCKTHRVLVFPPGGGGPARVLGGGGGGAAGGGPGRLAGPTGIAVDARGRVYVAERDRHRVAIFAAEHEAAAAAADPYADADAADAADAGGGDAGGGVVVGWLGRGEGSGPGQLRHPRGVALEGAGGGGGRVYVADCGTTGCRPSGPTAGRPAASGGRGGGPGSCAGPRGWRWTGAGGWWWRTTTTTACRSAGPLPHPPSRPLAPR